jgi:6-phosphogluconolactonase
MRLKEEKKMSNQKIRIFIANDLEQLAVLGADRFKMEVLDTVRHSNECNVAISGGTAPRPMNRLLAQTPYRHEIPWIQTHLYWVDERLLPPTDPDSNYGNAKMDFLDHIDIPTENVHPMSSENNPATAVETYQQRLRRFSNPARAPYPVFDLIFLGIGTDGHTASIFPEDATALKTDRWVCSVKGGDPNVDRLTLTLPLINQAKCIIILACGQRKSEIIRTIFRDKQAKLPIQKVAPLQGRLIWLLDQDAAARLPENIKMAAERV